jgi:hypothetical protein
MHAAPSVRHGWARCAAAQVWRKRATDVTPTGRVQRIQARRAS